MPIGRAQDPQWIRLQVGWLLGAVAGSDGTDHERERELVRRFLQVRFGEGYDPSRTLDGKPLRLDQKRLRRIAAELRRSLSASERETVLDWCCRIAHADRRFPTGEFDAVSQIARGLGIGERDTLRILYRARHDPGQQQAGAGRSRDHRASEPGPRGREHALRLMGLESDATHETVRARYRELVRTWHPDLHEHLGPAAAEEAHARFREIQAAYESLCS